MIETDLFGDESDGKVGLQQQQLRLVDAEPQQIFERRAIQSFERRITLKDFTTFSGKSQNAVRKQAAPGV